MSIWAESRLRRSKSILAVPIWRKWHTDGRSLRMSCRMEGQPMGGYEDRQSWIFGGRVILFLGVAVGFGYPVAGCHRVPPLTPQEAEGKHFYSVRCAHCHEDNDLALKKVPPDLHDVFTRSALPSGVPAT